MKFRQKEINKRKKFEEIIQETQIVLQGINYLICQILINMRVKVIKSKGLFKKSLKRKMNKRKLNKKCKQVLNKLKATLRLIINLLIFNSWIQKQISKETLKFISRIIIYKM